MNTQNRIPLFLLSYAILTLFFMYPAQIFATQSCTPLRADSIISLNYQFKDVSGCQFSVVLADEFKGKMWVNENEINKRDLKITANTIYGEIELKPAMHINRRTCLLVADRPMEQMEIISIDIPAGYFEVCPDYLEVADIDIDEDLLSDFKIAGAWHKPGTDWNMPGMFSIIDDDSLDGQIPSSTPSPYTYGYYSLMYPLLESLGLKGNLAVEGRRTGLSANNPKPNDNLKTVIRLQNEKGWDILAHSMICIGEVLNNWMVDSLSTPLADKILAEGPNKGERSATVSVYDMKTKKQYWPNADNSAWVETPSKFIKPYIGDYETKKEVLYNPDFDTDWHWGEWKRRAIEFGVDPKGFVTHNSTSSHAMVPGIIKYFPEGFSDLSTKNINTVPMLTTAVRSGLEGQSMKGYNGNSKDNTFNEEQFSKFCSQIDEAAATGGWIMFNLHAYRDCWKNSLPGSLVSEGGSYPDEWEIPMKGLDSANDPLSPPAHLGISEWSEWYPCPGTRLHMMWEILKYAKQKGLLNVTSSEGFEIMGNRKAYGYFSQGHRFGMDSRPGIGTREMYPHYIVSATGETFYYNPLISENMSMEFPENNSVSDIVAPEKGCFRVTPQYAVWKSSDDADVSVVVLDASGKEILRSPSSSIFLNSLAKGCYILCAFKSNRMIGTLKILQ